MSKGDSTRTFHPHYTPLRGVTSGVKNPESSESPTAKSQLQQESKRKRGKCESDQLSSVTSELTTATVRVKRKKTKNGRERIVIKKRKPRVDKDDSFDQAVEILDYWCKLYDEALGVPYELGTSSRRLSLCDEILDRLKTTTKVKAFMKALLTHPDLNWVGQKTLDFLSKPSNQTRIAPVLRKRLNKSRAEFSGDRSTETKITFRSI